jgi:hypothetical protein
MEDSVALLHGMSCSKNQNGFNSTFSSPELPAGEYDLKASKPGQFTVKTEGNVTKKSKNFLYILEEAK